MLRKKPPFDNSTALRIRAMHFHKFAFLRQMGGKQLRKRAFKAAPLLSIDAIDREFAYYLF